MRTDRPIGELDLLAYIDGLLEPQRRAEVEAHLAARPDEAAWVEDCLRQNGLIRELHDGPYREPLPAPLRRALDGRRPAVRAASPLRRIAAALLLVVGGGLAGWWIGQAEPFGPDAAEAVLHDMVAAHAAARPAATGGRAVELAAGAELPALSNLQLPDVPSPAGGPDLSAHGFTLVGRGTAPGPSGRPVLRLTYEDIGGRLVSVYLRPLGTEGPGPGVRVTERAGLAVAYGLTGPLVYGVVGRLPQDEVVAIARSVRRSLPVVGDEPPAPVAAAGDGAPALDPVAVPVPEAPAAAGAEGAAEM